MGDVVRGHFTAHINSDESAISVNGGGNGGPPVDRDIEKYIDAKAEATRAMFETSTSKVESKFDEIILKLHGLEALPDMQRDITELKIQAQNEIPRLIGQAIGIILGMLALGMVALNIYQAGANITTTKAKSVEEVKVVAPVAIKKNDEPEKSTKPE